MASHAAQANENLDPDAKARKKFGEKLSKILLDNKGEEFLSFLGVKKTNSGRISEKDIKEFIESGEGLEALNDTTIQELVDGYYENVLKETTRLTPSDMLGGDHATRFYMDKIDASNTEELWQFQTKYAEQPDAPLSIKSDRLIVQAQKDKNRVRVKPQAFHKSEIAKTTVEQVIEMTSAMPGTYWAADALQGAV